jgi:hypothetical protein
MKEGRWGIIALTRVAKLLKYLLLEIPDCPLLKSTPNILFKTLPPVSKR